jgi:prepilin-type N-terminal cleavage/methylation domain-containing protein
MRRMDLRNLILHRAPSFRFVRHNAFTFIELLIVIVIIGILAGIAVPRYVGFNARQRADAAARRITSDLAYVQRLAKTTSRFKTVNFSTISDMYTVLGVDDFDGAGTPYRVQLGEEPYLATIDSVNFGGDSKLVFDGYGDPEDGTIVISVGVHQRTLTVGSGGGAIIELPVGEAVQ